MKKLLGEERRELLQKMLIEEQKPIKGTDLAKFANVSRQVIVNDMMLLKARNVPILATSQGYMYIQKQDSEEQFEKQLACLHTGDETKEELFAIVDAGATVNNVTVEHPVYGEITASIMVSSRHDVEQFMAKVEETGASFLLELTGGIHLHLISASSKEILDRAEVSLREKGFLLEEN